MIEEIAQPAPSEATPLESLQRMAGLPLLSCEADYLRAVKEAARRDYDNAYKANQLSLRTGAITDQEFYKRDREESKRQAERIREAATLVSKGALRWLRGAPDLPLNAQMEISDRAMGMLVDELRNQEVASYSEPPCSSRRDMLELNLLTTRNAVILSAKNRRPLIAAQALLAGCHPGGAR